MMEILAPHLGVVEAFLVVFGILGCVATWYIAKLVSKIDVLKHTFDKYTTDHKDDHKDISNVITDVKERIFQCRERVDTVSNELSFLKGKIE